MDLVLDLLSEIVICHQFIGVTVPQCKMSCGVGNLEVYAKLTDDVLDGKGRVDASANSDTVLGGDIVGWNECRRGGLWLCPVSGRGRECSA